MPARKDYHTYHVQVPKELYARMKQAAKDDNRSMIGWMLQSFKERVEEHERNNITRPWIPSGLKRIHGG